MRTIALFLALFLFTATSARAQTDDPRAGILKSQIEGMIENQKAMAARNGCKLETTGDVTVEKASGYYAFTLPNMTYTDAKGVRSDIGMLALNAVPSGNDTWNVSMALPTPINSYDKGGTQTFKTDFGTQKISGVWQERLGHFTSLNASFDNIRINDLANQSTAGISTLTFTSSLSGSGSRYSGKARVEGQNITSFLAASAFRGALPKIVMETDLSDTAQSKPLTKEDIKSRDSASQPDFYNVFSMLFGKPEKLNAKITGLDALSANLQQSMITAPSSQRQNYLQSILVVTGLSAMGNPVAGDTATKQYDVTFSKDGGVSVNGSDLSGLTAKKSAAR